MQGVVVCIEDSRPRVRRLCASFENESNAKLRCHYALCNRHWSAVNLHATEWALHVDFLLSSLVGSHSPPAYLSYTWIFAASTLPFERPFNWTLYTRVISPRQPPSMVLEVYVLARTKLEVSKIQVWDTLPADRSLRFQAIIGSGLMARDNLLCTVPNLLSSSGRYCKYLW